MPLPTAIPTPLPLDPAAPDAARRLLIVRPSALGDVARSVFAAASVRASFPSVEVHWLVDRRFADVVAAHPAVDAVVPFDRRRKRSLWGLLKRLRGGGYDTVIDLQGLARSAAFTWWTRAGRRYGHADAREGAWLAYRPRVAGPAWAGGSGGHAVHDVERLLCAAGVEPVRDPRLYPPAAGVAEAAASGVPRGPGVLALAPTARWGSKCWPMPRWVALARALVPSRFERLLVVAAPHEQARVRPLLGAVPGAGVAACPELSVGGTMAAIGGAGLLVGNDSAPLHLAVGLGVPTVSLFGPTEPSRVGPINFWGQTPAGRLTPETHRVLRAPAPPGVEAGGGRGYRSLGDDDAWMRGLPLDAVVAAAEAAPLARRVSIVDGVGSAGGGSGGGVG